MKVPHGRLLRSRVVSNPATAFSTVLDDSLTGYLVFEPQDTLLLDDRGRGVVTVRNGVPVLVYHTGTDRGGVDGLADLAVPGPYKIDVFELSDAEIERLHDADELRVPPGEPAERVAGDPHLADRTRSRAREHGLFPDDVANLDTNEDAVVSFLSDEERIEAIKRQAREDAERQASEWGLNDELAGSDQ
ncbi:hypothetical protein [Natranaeroarchaeum aerophilus]|uniref:DUF8054 domain-containing protein n=1 Tax=Natranaeroarchaeum aerophilus TaxID=2917711 RepID=A0AAE3FSS7_9EURY|nr:hypothetical protein [Natranaeroarchaeum aerophilus]MCL9814491.1 hypothetical protein [Natranaeroarchaeum aerophilus]